MKNLWKILFPIKQSFDDINEPNELEQIQINNYNLAKQMDADKLKWNEQQKANRLKLEAEIDEDYPLKTYYLDVISGGIVMEYTIDARGYEWGSSGSTFWFYTYKLDEHGRRRQDILAHFPVHKTIIRKIELCSQ